MPSIMMGREVIVQVFLGQRYVLDRDEALARLELDDSVNPHPAHGWNSIRPGEITPSACARRTR
jgi:hypothetical protein